MKVCTDSCLFGACVARQIQKQDLQPNNILDIGTGTGLLSLMLAQVTGASIDAVEIDSGAANQAQDNFQNSPWSNRLSVINQDIKELQVAKNYDMVISNPPFFEGDLKSDKAARNNALHSDALTLKELITIAHNLLTAGGLLAVILPFHRTTEFITNAAECQLFIREHVVVKQTEKHSFFRSMLLMSRNKCEEKETPITIKEKGQYTSEFIDLLKPFYLNL